MIKALFFDIDGTLVSFRTHQIPESSLKALALLRERGIRLFIATGRHYTDLNNIETAPFDGFVTLNGQYCYNREGVIYEQRICAEDIRRTVEVVERNQFACMFIEEHRMYVNRMDDRVRAAQSLINFLDPEVAPSHTALGQPIYQLMPFVTPEQEAVLMSALRCCDATRWNTYFMDVVPQGGSKQTGIEAMLRTYGLQREEIAAFGDGQNDITMLRYASVGVAMGNADAEVKAAADYVTDEIDDDGLWHALQYLQLV